MSAPFTLPNGLPGAFASPINSATSIFQVGSYNVLHDTFTLEVDLNDFLTYWIEFNSMKMPQPEKVYSRSFNPRTPGEIISHVQYKNRHIQVSVRLKGATTQAILNSIRVLLEAIESPPYTLRIALPNATQYSYADVVAVKHNIPTDPMALKALIIPSIQIDFECLPGLRGDRIWLQNLVCNPGMEAPSGPGVQAFSDAFANVNAYAVQAGSAPSVAANVMTVAAASRIAFGSPAWGGYNLWSLRFKWVTGLIATFYLHFTDANNYLAVVVNGTTLVLQHTIAGITATIQSSAAVLVNGNFYWLQTSQFPQLSGLTPEGFATLYNDAGPGNVGTVVATASGQLNSPTVALVGRPQIAASGASLAIGGAFSNVHTVSLFGPGGWGHAGVDTGTGQTSMAWDGSQAQNGMSGTGGANTYPGGPVTSTGAVRLDMPPAGTVNTSVYGYGGGNPALGTAMPVKTIGNVLGVSAYVKTASMGSGSTCTLQVFEYDNTGTFLRNATVQTITGNHSSWTQLSGNYTTGASCAFAGVWLVVIDASTGSVNGTVWLDNVQAWDITNTGMATMPYCEERFLQSPGMMILSGLAGDMPAPAIVMMGGYINSLTTGHTCSLIIGRKAVPTSSMRLVMPSTAGGGCALDSTAYGGFSALANPGAFYGSTQNESGIFNFLTRAQTANASPVNNVFLQAQAFMVQSQFGPAVTSPTPGSWQGPQTFPFGAQNVWSHCNLGQVILPISPTGALSDPTQISAYISSTSGAVSSGSSGLTVNTVSMLPVDGELFLARASNSASNSTTLNTTWVYMYWDGVQFTTTYSLESVAQPSPQHAVANPQGTAPIVFSGNVQLTFTPTGDTNAQVDPTVGTSLAVGVNQYLALFLDNVNTVLPIACDIIYSPLYLYPR